MEYSMKASPISHKGSSADGSSNTPRFFRYHGVMAPGIRLFRSISFPAKSAWVSLAFLVPLVGLCFSLWGYAADSIDFSRHELLGLRYIEATMPLLKDAQLRRKAAMVNDSSALSGAEQKIASDIANIEAVRRELASKGDAPESWDRLSKALADIQANPIKADKDQTLKAHTALIERVITYISDVADSSNLTLDPELRTFYLMSAAIFEAPQVIESMAILRGVGNAAMVEHTATRRMKAQLDVAHANAFIYSEKLIRDLSRADFKAFMIKENVNLDQVHGRLKSFLADVEKNLLDENISGDPNAYAADATAIINETFENSEKIAKQLEIEIHDRIANEQHKLVARLVVSACGVLVAIYLLVAFYRVTQGGIAEVARHLEDMSQGKLLTRLNPWGKDEIAQLMSTLDTAMQSLRQTVGLVRDGAFEIETASGEVSAASIDLSQRTEHAASQLEATSTAMTTIQETVQRTSDTAASAHEIVLRNESVAAEGGKVVTRVVVTMQEIRDSSSRIAEIIGTIEGIAFQTNILALNAAVEAARAGEQGRGFAVVASEVRALAQRSSNAAKEIKELIHKSVEQVESGTEVVSEAGRAMTEVVQSATRIRSLMSEVSHSAAEQSQGLREVAVAISELDAMTQQNAAMVEQTSAAAISLKDSARRLNQGMAFFHA
jgi:methyl-accepting chemotaxis protein